MEHGEKTLKVMRPLSYVWAAALYGYKYFLDLTQLYSSRRNFLCSPKAQYWSTYGSLGLFFSKMPSHADMTCVPVHGKPPRDNVMELCPDSNRDSDRSMCRARIQVQRTKKYACSMGRCRRVRRKPKTRAWRYSCVRDLRAQKTSTKCRMQDLPSPKHLHASLMQRICLSTMWSHAQLSCI